MQIYLAQFPQPVAGAVPAKYSVFHHGVMLNRPALWQLLSGEHCIVPVDKFAYV